MTSDSLRRAAVALTIGGGLALAACTQPAPAPTPAATPPPPKTRAVAAPTTPHWDYGAEHGPASWASLSPDFATCAAGKSQSPIDIVSAKTETVASLRTSYAPAELRVVHHEHVADGINNGHTVQVNYEGADSLTIGEETFSLVQYHLHSPSENTVDGKHYAMEMHLVHKSGAGKLAVLGVFIEEGAENAAYAPVWSNLPKQKGTEFHLEHVRVNVDDLLPEERTTWRFDGSLTTPPCTEGVNGWSSRSRCRSRRSRSRPSGP
jgi:carbonic anhydrase